MGCGKSKPADVAAGNVTQKKKSFSKSASKREDTNQTNPDIAAKTESTTTSSSSGDTTNVSNQQQESEVAISKEDQGTQNVAGVTENVAAITEKVASVTANVTSVTENFAGVVQNVAVITENVKVVEDVPQTEIAEEGEVVGSTEQKERVVQNVTVIIENVNVVKDVPQIEIAKEEEVVGSTEQKERVVENVGGGDVGQDNVDAVEGMTSRDSTNSFSSARIEEEAFDSVASEVKSESASLQADNSSALVADEEEKVGDAATVVKTNELVEKNQTEVAAETEAPAMISGTSGAGDTSNEDEAKADSSAKGVKAA